MNVYPFDTQLQQRLRKYANVFAIAVAAIALLVLFGWAFQWPFLRRPVVELVAMNPLTALLFIFFALAMQLLLRPAIKIAKPAGLCIASLILLIALCRLADVFFGTETRLDGILFPDEIAKDVFEGQPNRMAPNTAMGFAFLSLALLLQPAGRRSGSKPADFALIPVTLIGFFGLLGYLYGVSAFYGVLHYIPMALHTALCFLLSVLALLLAEPDRGIMRSFTTIFSGSQSGRYLVPAVILVPVVLGHIRLFADSKLHFPVGFGVAMLVIGIIAVLLSLVVYNTKSLNAKDALQFETQARMSQLNQELEKRVEERSAVAFKNQVRLQNVMDHMLEGVQIVDFGWKYLYANEAVARQARLPREQLLGKIVTDLYSVKDNPAVFKVLQLCMKGRMPQHAESRFIFPDGRVGWFEMSIQPIPEGIFILTVDITDRKLAEEQLQKAHYDLEKKVSERTAQLQFLNQELESFAYSISHDLRSPVRAVEGFAQALGDKSHLASDAESARLVGAIQTAAARMNNLIDAILKLSQLGAQSLVCSPVDMNQLVHEVLREISDPAAKSAQIHVEDLHTVEADCALMKQVFVNLLSNALKYSAKKPDPKIRVSSKITGEKVIYSISDNGVGFDMQYADTLFGAFQRMHNAKDFAGTGVGLAIVQRIVHRHGGEVWAEAAPGQGATFFFSLPIKQES